MTVATHLMFQNGQAATALDLYRAVFPGFAVISIARYGPDDAVPGQIKTAEIDFAGHRLIVIDSPISHAFDFTPSVSLFVNFAGVEELDDAFDKLAVDGEVLMPLGAYGFSARFGWLTDRFGVSWQLNLPTSA
ncbi:MAG: VOC family protein [Pseudomonadota bacterium]